jgi:hypothetical protein
MALGIFKESPESSRASPEAPQLIMLSDKTAHAVGVFLAKTAGGKTS